MTSDEQAGESSQDYPQGVPPEDMAERFDEPAVEREAEAAEQQGGGTEEADEAEHDEEHDEDHDDGPVGA